MSIDVSFNNRSLSPTQKHQQGKGRVQCAQTGFCEVHTVSWKLYLFPLHTEHNFPVEDMLFPSAMLICKQQINQPREKWVMQEFELVEMCNPLFVGGLRQAASISFGQTKKKSPFGNKWTWRYNTRVWLKLHLVNQATSFCCANCSYTCRFHHRSTKPTPKQFCDFVLGWVISSTWCHLAKCPISSPKFLNSCYHVEQIPVHEKSGSFFQPMICQFQCICHVASCTSIS